MCGPVPDPALNSLRVEDGAVSQRLRMIANAVRGRPPAYAWNCLVWGPAGAVADSQRMNAFRGCAWALRWSRSRTAGRSVQRTPVGRSRR
jgi:hypothetical protein